MAVRMTATEQAVHNWALTQFGSPGGKLSLAGQRLWKYTTTRRASGRWRGLPAKGVRRRLTITALLFAAVFLLALAYVSMSDIRAGGAQGAAAGLGGRTGGGNFGLRMLSSLGVGGAVGGAVSGRQEPASEMPAAMLLDMPETRPGFYAANLTASGRLAVRPRPSMVLRYEACGGLFNQYYCHLSAFAMGVALGVDGIVMPHAKRRRAFTAANTTWEGAGAETLWDLAAIRRYAGAKNISVTVVPPFLPNYVIDGFGGFNPYGLRRKAVVNFPYMGNELWTMPEFVDAALRRIDAHRDFHEIGPTPTTEAGLRWREVRGLFTTDSQPRVPHWARLLDPSYSREAWQSGAAAAAIGHTRGWVDDWQLVGDNATWGEGSQVWELFGRFIANETFAHEMDISLVPLNESDIPHVDSNPKLKDGLQRPKLINGTKVYQLGAPPERVLLNLPCVMHSVRALDSPLMTEVALNWGFAPAAQRLADKIIAGMAKWTGHPRPGGFRFNGVHLRLEGDASRWIVANGGVRAMWDAYFAACRGVNEKLPLFVASGIWSDMTPVHAENLKRLQEEAGSRLHKASDFLSAAELAGLHSEQHSLVDFLVVLRSESFVGIDASTFSVAVQQHRRLRGISANKGAMVKVKGLPDFHGEMMRLGSTFTDYPVRTVSLDEPGTDTLA